MSTPQSWPMLERLLNVHNGVLVQLALLPCADEVWIDDVSHSVHLVLLDRLVGFLEGQHQIPEAGRDLGVRCQSFVNGVTARERLTVYAIRTGTHRLAKLLRHDVAIVAHVSAWVAVADAQEVRETRNVEIRTAQDFQRERRAAVVRNAQPGRGFNSIDGVIADGAWGTNRVHCWRYRYRHFGGPSGHFLHVDQVCRAVAYEAHRELGVELAVCSHLDWSLHETWLG